jgi:eukaryotic-like serine/threonine-protein kinase
MAEIHINVGIVALSRGLISLEGFARGMQTLANANAPTVREVWAGVLDEHQLETLMSAVTNGGRARDTMLITETQPRQASGSNTPLSPVTLPARPPSAPRVQAGTAPTDAQVPMPSPSSPATVVTSIDMPAMPLDSVGNRYKKLFLLGKGGLGEVTACEDLVLGRTVAVKAGFDKQDSDSFSSKVILAREARIVAALEHPNIIPIYDAGMDGQRGPFYVMRQVTDTSLEMILHRRKVVEGDPHDYTLHRLLRYFLQVCNAVDYAHHKGVVHCDIKPANILLGEYGEVLLVDWGLAQSRNHPLGVRGGTLGYMAPEQMDPRIERFDERTDVFALGAILYEILSGKAAFEDARNSDITTIGADPLRAYRTPPLPSVVAQVTGLEVPREIEDVCMRAIAVHRSERLNSVGELSTAIDEYIEGSKERERKKLEANRNADVGDELAERYHEFVESRPEKMTVYRALRADVVPWAPPDEKQDLWDAEDIVRVTDALQVRTFHSAVSAYERALDNVPDHPQARRGISRLFYSELQRARQRGDELDQIAYEQLLREVDDGTFVRELQRDGIVEITIGEHAGEVTLAPLVEKNRRLVPGTEEQLTERPLVRRSLPAGRYVITATRGEVCVSWPVSIDPGAHCEYEIAPKPGCVHGENEILVPGGKARLGGDPLSTETDEPTLVDVPSFVIQRFPVTFGEWFDWLEELRETDPRAAEAHTPRTTVGASGWDLAKSGMFIDPYRLPVIGISALSAEMYAAWLSKKTGQAWRLPLELEWEKAGRGTDSRVYPWGDHFDATFCKMRDSRAGLPVVEPIGTFEADVSPYGVHDLAGGVADWCVPDFRRTAPREPREVVSRGGAWCDWAIDCRLASRRRYLATEHSARVGVRLARDA